MRGGRDVVENILFGEHHIACVSDCTDKEICSSDVVTQGATFQYEDYVGYMKLTLLFTRCCMDTSISTHTFLYNLECDIIDITCIYMYIYIYHVCVVVRYKIQ